MLFTFIKVRVHAGLLEVMAVLAVQGHTVADLDQLDSSIFKYVTICTIICYADVTNCLTIGAQCEPVHGVMLLQQLILSQVNRMM